MNFFLNSGRARVNQAGRKPSEIGLAGTLENRDAKTAPRPLTFCRCAGWRRSPNADVSGSSNASRASVRSSSLSISGFCSPRSARCVWANSSASSTRFSRISSIRWCCWRREEEEEEEENGVEEKKRGGKKSGKGKKTGEENGG